MRKIDFLHCAEFLEIKKLMGISDDEPDFTLDDSTPKLHNTSKTPTNIFNNYSPKFTKEISSTDTKINFTKDGRIKYDKEIVILYICDQFQDFKNQSSEYKFHVADCPTLSRMRNCYQYDRYVVSNEISDIFKVNKIVKGEIVAVKKKLKVCKHCLQKLDWKGYRSATPRKKDSIYRHFSIAEFFAF